MVEYNKLCEGCIYQYACDGRCDDTDPLYYDEENDNEDNYE